ncbi:DoxX family protein [Deinococcus caeni]|uniref:DoxX family protein n=1 Tax=Deinococcus caeni TaxID=569127 RepID=UPI003610B5B0
MTTTATTHHTDLALLTVRLATGLIFVMHGAQKIFTYTLPGTTQAFTQMGAPCPPSAPPGRRGRTDRRPAADRRHPDPLAGGALSLIMLGAIALVHLKAGFFNPNGVEFPLSLLAATVALTLAGPGRYRVPGLPA